MINLDDRIFEDVKKPEHMWLLLHIARRIGKNRDCWPKNFTLAKDCNWSENTVQKYKKQLKELGLLTIEKRFVNNKQAANSYLVNTPDIKLYIPINQIPTQDLGTQDVGTQSVGTQDLGNRSINKIEVLINKNNSYIGQIKDLQRERENLKAQLRELTEKQPKPKRKRFSPPSIEQITEHFTQKGSDQAEAENFFNFYESNGWKVGKNKMVNWKAAGTNWVKRNGKTHKPKTKNLVQRYVDYLNSHIENKILRKEHKKYEILYLIAGKDETVRQINNFKSKLDITNPTYTDCFIFDITYGTLAKRAGTKPDRRMGEFKQFYNTLSDYNKNKGILRKLFKTYLIKKFG